MIRFTPHHHHYFESCGEKAKGGERVRDRGSCDALARKDCVSQDGTRTVGGLKICSEDGAVPCGQKGCEWPQGALGTGATSLDFPVFDHQNPRPLCSKKSLLPHNSTLTAGDSQALSFSLGKYY